MADFGVDVDVQSRGMILNRRGQRPTRMGVVGVFDDEGAGGVGYAPGSGIQVEYCFAEGRVPEQLKVFCLPDAACGGNVNDYPISATNGQRPRVGRRRVSSRVHKRLQAQPCAAGVVLAGEEGVSSTQIGA